MRQRPIRRGWQRLLSQAPLRHRLMLTTRLPYMISSGHDGMCCTRVVKAAEWWYPTLGPCKHVAGQAAIQFNGPR